MAGATRSRTDSSEPDMSYLDTNCLLRWFLDDIPGHADRVEQQIANEPGIIVDDVIIVETIFVLETVMKLSRKTISSYLDAMKTYSLQFDRKLWSEVLPIWQSHPKLSIVDVYLSIKAKQHNKGPVYTFDHKMLKQLPGTDPIPT